MFLKLIFVTFVSALVLERFEVKKTAQNPTRCLLCFGKYAVQCQTALENLDTFKDRKQVHSTIVTRFPTDQLHFNFDKNEIKIK